MGTSGQDPESGEPDRSETAGGLPDWRDQSEQLDESERLESQEQSEQPEQPELLERLESRDRSQEQGSAGRAVVRTAEQTVGDAWIGQLLAAEHEAGVEAAERLKVRSRLAERLLQSRRSGDTTRTSLLRVRLARADRQSAEAVADYEGLRGLLARELREWALATRGRKAASHVDQRRGEA